MDLRTALCLKFCANITNVKERTKSEKCYFDIPIGIARFSRLEETYFPHDFKLLKSRLSLLDQRNIKYSVWELIHLRYIS